MGTPLELQFEQANAFAEAAINAVSNLPEIDPVAAGFLEDATAFLHDVLAQAEACTQALSHINYSPTRSRSLILNTRMFAHTLPAYLREFVFEVMIHPLSLHTPHTHTHTHAHTHTHTHTWDTRAMAAPLPVRWRGLARGSYASIRQHTSAYVSIRDLGAGEA